MPVGPESFAREPPRAPLRKKKWGRDCVLERDGRGNETKPQLDSGRDSQRMRGAVVESSCDVELEVFVLGATNGSAMG